MPRSNYVLQPDVKTFCPDCHRNVYLLCREDGNNKKPWFYICHHCGMVAEVGKGRVIIATDYATNLAFNRYNRTMDQKENDE